VGRFPLLRMVWIFFVLGVEVETLTLKLANLSKWGVHLLTAGLLAVFSAILEALVPQAM